MSLDRYQLGEILCTQWNEDMAARFPNADHRGCRQEMQPGPLVEKPFADPYREWIPFDPVRCHGYHCNRCGAPTNMFGHRSCPDKPQQ